MLSCIRRKRLFKSSARCDRVLASTGAGSSSTHSPVCYMAWMAAPAEIVVRPPPAPERRRRRRPELWELDCDVQGAARAAAADPVAVVSAMCGLERARAARPALGRPDGPARSIGRFSTPKDVARGVTAIFPPRRSCGTRCDHRQDANVRDDSHSSATREDERAGHVSRASAEWCCVGRAHENRGAASEVP